MTLTLYQNLGSRDLNYTKYLVGQLRILYFIDLESFCFSREIAEMSTLKDIDIFIIKCFKCSYLNLLFLITNLSFTLSCGGINKCISKKRYVCYTLNHNVTWTYFYCGKKKKYYGTWFSFLFASIVSFIFCMKTQIYSFNIFINFIIK